MDLTICRQSHLRSVYTVYFVPIGDFLLHLNDNNYSVTYYSFNCIIVTNILCQEPTHCGITETWPIRPTYTYYWNIYSHSEFFSFNFYTLQYRFHNRMENYPRNLTNHLCHNSFFRRISICLFVSDFFLPTHRAYTKGTRLPSFSNIALETIPLVLSPSGWFIKYIRFCESGNDQMGHQLRRMGVICLSKRDKENLTDTFLCVLSAWSTILDTLFALITRSLIKLGYFPLYEITKPRYLMLLAACIAPPPYLKHTDAYVCSDSTIVLLCSVLTTKPHL